MNGIGGYPQNGIALGLDNIKSYGFSTKEGWEDHQKRSVLKKISDKRKPYDRKYYLTRLIEQLEESLIEIDENISIKEKEINEDPNSPLKKYRERDLRSLKRSKERIREKLILAKVKREEILYGKMEPLEISED